METLHRDSFFEYCDTPEELFITTTESCAYQEEPHRNISRQWPNFDKTLPHISKEKSLKDFPWTWVEISKSRIGNGNGLSR